jgi:hypothetical protein
MSEENLDIINQLRQLLAEATGNELEEIFSESHLQEDLNIDLMEDFPRLMAKINHGFEINLKIEEVLNELEEAGETVGELSKLIKDEYELG